MAAKAKPERRFFLAATALTHADNLDRQEKKGGHMQSHKPFTKHALNLILGR